MTPLLPALAVAITSGAFLLQRRRSRTIEVSVAQRFPLGPDGVIPGAQSVSLNGEGPAVLILHGFGDTPQSVRSLADHLHENGWMVRAPLLPGHGRTLREFAQSRAEEWRQCALEEYDELRRRFGPVAVVGQSMGGALALVIAAERKDVPALVLLAPYLTMNPKVTRLARAHVLLELVTPYVRSRSESSIWDAAERDRSLGLGYVAPRALAELLAMTRVAWKAAPHARAPALVLQSTSDNRIRAADASRAFARLGSSCKELHWLTGCGHVIAVDLRREEVFARTEDWLHRYGPG